MFLECYARTGNITAAAELAGLSRQSHYRWADESPAYAVAFREASDIAVDRLIDEARRRALGGSDVLLPTPSCWHC
jgi:hypothetical protein